MSIRILHVVGEMSRGGVETWLMHMLRNLDRRQIAMDFLCLSGEPGAYAPEIESLGGKIHLLRLNRLRLDRFQRDFTGLLRSEGYEVVHSHVLTFSGFLLWLAKRAGVSQRLAHFHTSKVTTEDRSDGLVRRAYLKAMNILLHKSATRFLACSQVAMAAVLGEKWQDLNNAEVLYCGIDLSPFRNKADPLAVRQELGLPVTSKVVGHVGSFIPAKNHKFIIKLAKELCVRRQDIRFLLVGDGPLRQEVEREVNEKGLAPFFVLTGARGDVPRLMQAMDLFILPSVREGLGIVLVEAQAASLPLVTSPLPAFKEVVFTPFHQNISLENPQAWAQACEAFLDKGLSRQISPEVQQGLERFSVHRCARRLTEIYRNGVG
jgi:glycosyltransferase involved in cell wall biosynthesis